MYKHNIKFLAEGYVEEKLFMFLKIPQDMIDNTQSMQKIPTRMVQNLEESHERIVLALIDDDKTNVPDYFQEFQENLEKVAHNLAYKKHLERPHILIVVHPAMEKWLLEIAQMNEVNPATHNLPTDFKNLKKKVTGKESVLKDKDFDNFLTELLEKSPELQTLKLWLQELKQKALPDYPQNYPQD
jgi:predicted metallo-beta-lactamase superfamily hydrolase